MATTRSVDASASPAAPALADSFPLPPPVLKNLSDRAFEKRRAGAQEVEKIMRRLRETDSRDAIRRVLQLLGTDFACNVNSNNRKGGLIGLASCAVGLTTQISDHLDLVVPPVLKNFTDQEPRVRYYACESLFNIVKICRSTILAYFNDVFVGVCRLIADTDAEVKNGAALFDRLLREIVMEAAASVGPSASGSGDDSGSDVTRRVVPLLRAHMGVFNPYVRQLLVGWISALDSVPGVDMLDHLGELLEGLFDMLSDGNREVRHAAHSTLSGFLTQIESLTGDEFIVRLQLGTIISVLLAQTGREKDKFNRVTAIEWLSHFIPLGRSRLAPWYPSLVATLLRGLSDTESELVKEVGKANADLMALVRSTPRSDMDGLVSDDGSGIVRGLLRTVRESLGQTNLVARSAALRWLAMLLQLAPDAVEEHLDQVLSALMGNLSDSNDINVLKLNLEVLARLSLIDPSWVLLRTRVLRDILRLFGEQRVLLETKAAFIIRRLCLLLDPATVYLGLADLLSKESNREFSALIVELLNLILLTSTELADFRDALRGCAATCEGCDAAEAPPTAPADAPYIVYTALFRTWVINPIATVSLCLLAHSHELASSLVSRLNEMQVTVGLLMQVDKLVQLIESPVFLDVRLALLRGADAHLLTALFGLLMVLPQGTAYATLRDRLTAVTTLLSVRPVVLRTADLDSRKITAAVGAASSAATDEKLAAGAAARSAFEEKVAAFSDVQKSARASLSAEIRSRSVLATAAVARDDTIGAATAAIIPNEIGELT